MTDVLHLQNCMVSFTFYPNLSIFLHRYICHICDILQLCPNVYAFEWKKASYHSGGYQNSLYFLLLIMFSIEVPFLNIMTMHLSFLPWQDCRTGRSKPENVEHKGETLKKELSRCPMKTKTSEEMTDESYFSTARPFQTQSTGLCGKTSKSNRWSGSHSPDKQSCFLHLCWKFVSPMMITTSKRLARSLTYWRRPRLSGTRCFTPHWLQNIGTCLVSWLRTIGLSFIVA